MKVENIKMFYIQKYKCYILENEKYIQLNVIEYF